jgi:hypothetical protein
MPAEEAILTDAESAVDSSQEVVVGVDIINPDELRLTGEGRALFGVGLVIE